jgi:glutathione S-transferase
MKLYLFPAGHAVSVLSLKNYLGIDCEVQRLDFKRNDQLKPDYVKLNPNKKMPTLEDREFVLWESNAILFYMAGKHPDKGLWPSDLKRQADVVRWFAWENAHWDSESVGMVSYEKGSIPSAKAMDLSIAKYPEISAGIHSSPASPGWHSKMSV